MSKSWFPSFDYGLRVEPKLEGYRLLIAGSLVRIQPAPPVQQQQVKEKRLKVKVRVYFFLSCSQDSTLRAVRASCSQDSTLRAVRASPLTFSLVRPAFGLNIRKISSPNKSWAEQVKA